MAMVQVFSVSWGCFWTEVPKLGGIVGKIQNNKPGKWFEGCTFKSNFQYIGRYHIIFLFILNKGVFLFFLMLCFLPLFSTSIPKATDLAFQRNGCASHLCPNTCSFRLVHDKASPRARGCRAYTSIRIWHSSRVLLWAPPLLQLRASAWWEVGQYSLPQKRDCEASRGFVGSRREAPGNCFLVEMAGYCAKPRVSCSV